MSFIFKKLNIPEVILIETTSYPDERGFFMETYKKSIFKENGILENFIQENHSVSKKNVLRGLHYQNDPHAQGKLVRCINGEIFDIALDIRKNSPTLGKWVSAILSKENNNQLYIPNGFAHGFCVMSEEAEVVYKCTKEYVPNAERGILWNDPTIHIEWPIINPILSKKDQNNLTFNEAIYEKK